MTLADITAALSRYGASLTDDGFICRDGRRLSVSLTVKRGRVVATGKSGKLYSGPAVPASVDRFVESYWFWTPTV